MCTRRLNLAFCVADSNIIAYKVVVVDQVSGQAGLTHNNYYGKVE